MPHWTALVTLLAILVYFSTSLLVGRARATYGVTAPATVGNADFERVFRVQMNTLEWMPIFLPVLWLFAFYVSDRGAAALGLVWCAARVFYIVSYRKAAARRGPGFGIQALVCLVLLLGAAAGIGYPALHPGNWLDQEVRHELTGVSGVADVYVQVAGVDSKSARCEGSAPI